MIILGVVLLIAGWLLNIGILSTIGWILLAIGVILLILGGLNRPVIGGRRYWY
jgi:hypothetical protein